MQYIEQIYSYIPNNIQPYIPATLIFLGSAIVLRLLRFFINKRVEVLAKKTKTDVDDLVAEVLKSIGLPFYIVISAYISLRYTNIVGDVMDIVSKVTFITVVFYSVKAVQRLVIYTIEKAWGKEKRAASGIKTVIKLILWLIGFAVILQNLGYNISTLIAGLGIGGVAVAFALQNILGDIFSSFSIYFDKPFEVGDFILIGDDMGTVTKIGMKSTRLTTLQGEELVVSNQELTSARVRNFKQMQERRVAFNIGVTYETSITKVKKINDIVKEIIKEEKHATLDRVNFNELGASSLNFEIVYYVDTQDYYVYMNIQESINIKLMEAFAKEKIEFAYPTQKIYLEK